MIVQISITNQFGDFLGKKVNLNDNQYEKLVEMVRNFYSNGGFELTLENEDFVVFPPEIVKNSFIKIIKID
jgi:hypothetical protein